MAENENINDCDGNLHYFEGVEKLLEIWFATKADNNADLRKIPRSMWDAMLKEVRCEIISFSRNDQIDAYVLSESSMFVSKRRWILKTCGTTTPLQCLEPLFKMAGRIAGFTDVDELFYSRKNFKRPELQVAPHRCFEEEVALLDSYFVGGRAYCLGAVNKDCWFLYTLSRRGSSDSRCFQRRIMNGNEAMLILSSDEEEEEEEEEEGVLEEKMSNLMMNESILTETPFDPDPDQTIEILMTELNPQIMAIFTKDVCGSGPEATEKVGINKILPGMKIDDYLFDPCGYSMNGIAKNGCYMTIHITPEQEFSYVSFESNVAASNYGDLIARVIEAFQPGKFVVTVFANKNSPAFAASRGMEHADKIGEWQRQDIQYCRLASYDLTYAMYSKFPS